MFTDRVAPHSLRRLPQPQRSRYPGKGWLITRILHQEQNKKGKVGLRRIVNNVFEVIEGLHLKDADLYRGDRFIAVRGLRIGSS